MGYKKCFFCSNKYHHGKKKLVNSCDICIRYGLTDINKPCVSNMCVSCDITFKSYTDEGIDRKVCNRCRHDGYLDNDIPIYKNDCGVCDKLFKYQSSQQRKICDNCIKIGFIETKSIKIANCVVCKTDFKYQHGNPTKCKNHENYETKKCIFCHIDTKSYSNVYCEPCEIISKTIFSDMEVDYTKFKKNYMLVCDYTSSFYPEIDIDDTYASCAMFDLTAFDITTKVYPLMNSITAKNIDVLGYIDINDKELKYYSNYLPDPNIIPYHYANVCANTFASTGISYMKLYKARVVKKSELFDFDEFNK
jgi:hypothetical protein